jgi:YHS domain-containing protein
MCASANKILTHPLKAFTHRKFVTLCGRIFRDTDPQYFPRAEYRGRTIYFCTEACLEAFSADPELFYQKHRNSEKTKGLKV